MSNTKPIPRRLKTLSLPLEVRTMLTRLAENDNRSESNFVGRLIQERYKIVFANVEVTPHKAATGEYR